MNENQSVQNVNNETKKPKKKFSEKSFGGKILTLIKWGIIGYFSVFVIFILIGVIVTSGDDNKEVSSTKDVEKIETTDEKEETETPEPEDTSQEEVVEEEPIIEDPEPEPIETYESRYPNHNKIGGHYKYGTDNGSTIDLSITDCGSYGYDMYVSFHIKNEGNEKVTVSSNLFRMYANNMSVDLDYMVEGMFGSETIDPGRETVGTIYGRISQDQVSVLELEVGNSGDPYILYDAELEAIAEAYEKANYTGYVNISSEDFERSILPYIEYGEVVPIEEVSGHYIDKGEGTDLVQYFDISLYPSMDEETGYIGEVHFMYNDMEWNLPIWCGEGNYYYGDSVTVPGVDFATSTIPGFDGEPGNYYIRLFIDGKSAGTLKRE